jgi:hypothetical protein
MGCGNVHSNKEEKVNSFGSQSNPNSYLVIFVDTSGGKPVQRKSSKNTKAKNSKQKGKKY